jgi:hypothetical protein
MYYHRKKLLFIPLIVAGIFLFVYVTMTLWNVLLPEIFSLPVINFWQAAGLVILTRLLFGFGHHSGRKNWSGPRMDRDLKSKIKNMSPEEKREFFRKMHYNREMWHRGCYDDKEQETEKKDNG